VYFGGTNGVVSQMVGNDVSTFVGTDLKRQFKHYVGDINCICDTNHPDYILVGVDNFTIYLLKAGRD
jgi:hypothetical protein